MTHSETGYMGRLETRNASLHSENDRLRADNDELRGTLGRIAAIAEYNIEQMESVPAIRRNGDWKRVLDQAEKSAGISLDTPDENVVKGTR